MSFIWYIVLFFFIQRSLCATDFIALENNEQSGSSLSDNVEKKINTEDVIFDDEKTSKEGSSIYNKEQLGFNERKRDEKRYGNQDTARKGHDKGRHSLGESEVVDHERNSFERRGSGYYKKGQHRTGFNNNYHKDESGNNSSFYEDSDDEGGHRSTGNNGGYYGQKSQNSFRDGWRDASYVERDKAQRGMYDNRKNFNDYHDHAGGYNDDRYTDNRRNHLRNEARRYFDKNGREVHYPNIYRNIDRVPAFGYSRYYIDTSPTGYYKKDPYSVDYRYSPYQRQRDNEQDLNYPFRGGYSKGYRDDLYDNGYLSKYRNGFDTGYHRI